MEESDVFRSKWSVIKEMDNYPYDLRLGYDLAAPLKLPFGSSQIINSFSPERSHYNKQIIGLQEKRGISEIPILYNILGHPDYECDREKFKIKLYRTGIIIFIKYSDLIPHPLTSFYYNDRNKSYVESKITSAIEDFINDKLILC